VKYFSGKVNQVSYQPHSADAFYHQYSYDAYPPGETPVVRKVMAGYFCLKKMMAKNESVREEMFKKIEAWKRSGQSQKAWCSEQRVAYHIFHYWYGQYRKSQAFPPTNQDFVSLTVRARSASSACEIVYPDGTRVVFHEPVNVSYLKSLLF
jgi:hypothetical protein